MSGKFLGDSSIERIVIGKYSSKSLVTLEMLEKSGDVQPENNERLRGEMKDVFQSPPLQGVAGGVDICSLR